MYKFKIANQARFFLHWFEDLFDRNILVQNKSLYNIHRGERCFILGTGTSVNDIDMSILGAEYSFCSNFLSYHKDFKKLNVNCSVMVSSPRELKNFHLNSNYSDSKIYKEQDIDIWLSEEKPMLYYSFDPEVYFKKIDLELCNNAIVFLGHKTKKFVEKRKLFTNKKVFYLKPYKSVLEADVQKYDLTNRITFHEGVIYTMIAIAFYMGFKELYLVGNDYTFEPSRQFHFYDQLLVSKNIKKEIALQWINKIAKARRMEVHNIMEDEEYYKPVFAKYNTNKDAHMVVKNLAESMGVKIFNIIPDEFKSPVYQGVTWRHVVEKVLNV